MYIKKRSNQRRLNQIINNQHVIKYELNILKKYRNKKNLSRGYEEFYISGIIELNITNRVDLDTFMENFLNSPLRSLNIKIIHEIKSSYYSQQFKYGVAEMNSVSNYVTLYNSH